MLTLAAMHVLNDTVDPFYTSLKAGAYDSKKPQGMPCDGAYTEGCGGPQLSEGGQIALWCHSRTHWPHHFLPPCMVGDALSQGTA